MKYKELFTPDEGVFTKIFHKYFEDDFNTIFDDTPANIDAYTYLKYGNKYLSEKITQENGTELIKSLISIDVNNWVNIVNLLNTEYNPLEPLIYKETSEGDKQFDEADNKDILKAEKTFNDNTFDDDRQEKNNSTRERQERVNNESVRTGLNSHLHPSEAIQKEMNLKKENIKMYIVAKLINQITIKIY